jgi:hypothetical protein
MTDAHIPTEAGVSRIFIHSICHAYESGMGRGLSKRALAQPYVEGCPQAIAYHEGWVIGRDRAAQSPEPRDDYRATYSRVALAARAITAKLQIVGDETGWKDGDETDRVYAWHEMLPLVAALNADIHQSSLEPRKQSAIEVAARRFWMRWNPSAGLDMAREYGVREEWNALDQALRDADSELGEDGRPAPTKSGSES